MQDCLGVHLRVHSAHYCALGNNLFFSKLIYTLYILGQNIVFWSNISINILGVKIEMPFHRHEKCHVLFFDQFSMLYFGLKCEFCRSVITH